MTDIGVAVVGCGYWGRNLVRNFSQLGALRGLVDPDPEVSRRLAAEYGVPSMSLEQALADDAVDAVAIGSPAPFHVDIAVHAARSGRHAFVEKPIALSMEGAQTIRRASEEAGTVLMVGHLLQYHAAFRALADQVAGGAVGRVLHIASSRLSMGKIRTEEDVLWSFAPHDLSMMLSLVDEAPDTIVSIGHRQVSDDLADTAHVHMVFPSGVTGRVHVSWYSPFKRQELVVTGDAGSIVFDDTRPWPDKVILTPHALKDGALAKGEPRTIEVAEMEPLKEECRHFLECCATGARPRTDVDEAARVLDVLVRASDTMADH